MSQFHHSNYAIGQKPVRQIVITILALMLCATALLAGCGGSTDPSAVNPASSPAPGTAAAPISEPTQGSSPNRPSAELEAAVQGYLTRNTSMPYKDVSIIVLSQDDAYATVEVHALLRPDAEKPWDEQVRTLQFALVSGQWKVSKTDSFASVAGLATATALAQIAAATAIADEEAGFLQEARTAKLDAVHMLSATEGWAIGENVILHYSGGEWVPQRIPDTMPGVHGTQGLRDVYMLSDSDGWIVGGDPASNGAIKYNVAFILHYDGSQWSTVGELPEAGKGYTLTAVDMVSPTEGWAVGNNTILHYTTASNVDTAGAGGGGGLGTWEKVQSPGDENYTFYDIKMVSADEGWATGGGGIMHYKGGTWSEVEPGVQEGMYCLAVVSADDVWAFGAYGHAAHYDGAVWTAQNLDPDAISSRLRLWGASFSSSSDGWAVDSTDGALLHYSDGKWQKLDDSPRPMRGGPNDLNGIFMLPTGEGWAVGGKGWILHYIDGKWEEFKR